MRRVTKKEAARISELSNELGERRLRTLLAHTQSEQKQSLISRRRLDNLQRGKGKLTQEESDRLKLVSANAGLIKKLGDKSKGKQDYKVNRAMRDWVVYGKERETPYEKGSRVRAVKGLAYLGVDPQEGTFYVQRRK